MHANLGVSSWRSVLSRIQTFQAPATQGSSPKDNGHPCDEREEFWVGSQYRWFFLQDDKLSKLRLLTDSLQKKSACSINEEWNESVKESLLGILLWWAGKYPAHRGRSKNYDPTMLRYVCLTVRPQLFEGWNVISNK